MSISRRAVLLSATAFALVSGSRVFAQDPATHVVEMLNKHPEDKKQRMVFHPRVLKVKPGDTVLFKSVDKGHNSQSIKGMIPEYAEKWTGKISKDIEVTFETPGIYGYMCTPHAATGMVGMVIVEGEGMLDNLSAAKEVKQRGRAKKTFEAIWEEAEAAGYLTDPNA